MYIMLPMCNFCLKKMNIFFIYKIATGGIELFHNRLYREGLGNAYFPYGKESDKKRYVNMGRNQESLVRISQPKCATFVEYVIVIIIIIGI